MPVTHLTNKEVATLLANAFQAWRISPEGAGITQAELASKSGVSLTSIGRFEKTGAITLRNLVALLRVVNLLDRLVALIPAPDAPGPLAQLAAQRKKPRRVRATRTGKPTVATETKGGESGN